MSKHKVGCLIAMVLSSLLILLACGEPDDPRLSPEGVARAFVKASAAGDCEKARSYCDWEFRRFPNACYCPALTAARIDAVQEVPFMEIVEVTLNGEFEYKGGKVDDTFKICTSPGGNFWYVLMVGGCL